MDNLSMWIALATANFIAFGVIKPWFDGHWVRGFLQGLLLASLVALAGFAYLHHHGGKRIERVIIQDVEIIFPVKKSTEDK